MVATTTATKPWTQWLVRLQILLALVMIVAIAGNNLAFLPFLTAFSTFSLSLLAVVALAVLGLLVLPWALWRNRALTAGALKAVVIGAIPVLVIVLTVGPKGFQVPAIHDISTDTVNPPQFEAALLDRDAAENSLDYAGAEIAELQRQAYPEVEPLQLSLSPTQVFERALAQTGQEGWQVLASDPSRGRIEAVATSALFGFKDDVVIRIRAQDQGSRVDVRSVSRVGKSDLGANAARIQQFLEALASS